MAASIITVLHQYVSVTMSGCGLTQLPVAIAVDSVDDVIQIHSAQKALERRDIRGRPTSIGKRNDLRSTAPRRRGPSLLKLRVRLSVLLQLLGPGIHVRDGFLRVFRVRSYVPRQCVTIRRKGILTLWTCEHGPDGFKGRGCTSSLQPMFGVLVGPQVTVAYVARGVLVEVATGSASMDEKAPAHGCCPADQMIELTSTQRRTGNFALDKIELLSAIKHARMSPRARSPLHDFNAGYGL